jgi:DivIVA domain-containing protein
MGTVLLVLVVVLVIAGLVYGVVTLLAGEDPGLSPADPDGRARPLPNNRSLSEFDLKDVRFDVGFRGYRMTQVDRVLRRTAYDIGYKDEMIAVLEAEVIALREGRAEDAELLRKAREAAAAPPPPVAVAGPAAGAHRAEPVEETDVISSDDDFDEQPLPHDDGSASDEDSDSPESDVDDPTAPGLLNREALRRVELPSTDATEESPDSSESDASSEPDEPATGTGDPSPEPGDRSSGPHDADTSEPGAASKAQRRART